MFSVLTSIAVAAECQTAVSDLDLRGYAAQAEEAFAAVDSKGFGEALRQLDVSVPCLSEPISMATAGRVFLVRGLKAHLDREMEKLAANLAAFAEVDELGPPSGVAPVGHPIRDAWQASREKGPSPRRELPVPEGGRIWIDGAETLDFPEERPSIVQLVVDGSVAWTSMVAPGQRLPDYREAPENAREQYYENKVIQTKQRHPYPLMVLTGVLAAGAVGTFVASTQTRKTYLSPNTAGSELRSLRTTTNLLYGVSVGVGVGAVGAGVATVVTW